MAFEIRDSILKNSHPKTRVTAESDRLDGLVQPRLLPCVTTICSAIMATMKVRSPARSNLMEV